MKPELPKYIYREKQDNDTLTMQYYRSGSGELRYEESVTCYSLGDRIRARQSFQAFTDALFQNEQLQT